MNAQHTPTPWTFGMIEVGKPVSVFDANMRRIGTIDADAVPTLARISANADLVAALRDMVTVVSPDGKDETCEPYFRDTLAKARAALAKADAT